MAKYRKKPVEVEAFELGKDEVPNWFREEGNIEIEFDCNGYQNENRMTLNGNTIVTVGEFIIRDAYGEIYSCEAGKFNTTYEKVED
ncbi:hypothetical protein [Metaclostridioides mangenotii]|uniref:Nuclear transport factor 2 (NTF2) superfamily protein n=1 Tax=Metaclostridioides mangenotii TaxID=1540 RepID=A0ABS4E9P8_9FIRM|nr:hypothetical protein [Clostridioides mangenotii]MBP1854671.1 nuclear transport factor 2 (NTF2) superfamily protein [Clostridioides mangenotii]